MPRRFGKVVVAGGHRDFFCGELRGNSLLVPRMHAEFSVGAFDALHAVAEPQVQLIVLGALAIILERFAARGLLRGARKRQIANFQQFRRGEKHHVDGVMVNGIAKAALVNHQRTHSRALGF